MFPALEDTAAAGSISLRGTGRAYPGSGIRSDLRGPLSGVWRIGGRSCRVSEKTPNRRFVISVRRFLIFVRRDEVCISPVCRCGPRRASLQGATRAGARSRAPRARAHAHTPGRHARARASSRAPRARVRARTPARARSGAPARAPCKHTHRARSRAPRARARARAHQPAPHSMSILSTVCVIVLLHYFH